MNDELLSFFFLFEFFGQFSVIDFNFLIGVFQKSRGI